MSLNPSYIYSDQDVLFGEPDIVGFGVKSFSIKEVPRDIANKIIIENHYSGKFYNCSYIHLACYAEERIIGILQFGYAMNPASMDKVVKNTKSDEYLELNRMWFENDLPKNTISRAMSYAIKYIKRKFRNIKWIQSFADERCGKLGIVYQSCNFRFYGVHKAVFWELEGKTYHNISMTAKKRARSGSEALYLQANKDRAIKHILRQFRYLYFIKQSSKKYLCFAEKPFPKHYEEEEVDANE